jgi:putative SOS response-associated peptidase YedK
MCARFTLASHDVELVARAFAAEVDPEGARLYRPRWNIAPTDQHWIVRLEDGRRRMVPARFGFRGRDGKVVVNARSETAARLPMFRQPFLDGRCIVPADGFYEWQGGRGERHPLWFHDPAGQLVSFAGLAAERDGELALVILTMVAAGAVAEVHDRMPVVLPAGAANAWLSGAEPELLVVPDGALVAREVSTKVNVVANDGPDLLDPPAPRQQLKLL